MKNSLEKIIDKTDLIVIGIAVSAAAVATGIYAAVAETGSVREAVELSAPIPWADSYWEALKTFASAAKYSLPGAALVGYIASKISKRF